MNGVDQVGKIRGYDCTGVWSPATGPAQTVTVDGAGYGDIAHTLDVHVHSANRATTNDMGAQAFFFLRSTGWLLQKLLADLRALEMFFDNAAPSRARRHKRIEAAAAFPVA